jgi:hypothetical protein
MERQAEREVGGEGDDSETGGGLCDVDGHNNDDDVALIKKNNKPKMIIIGMGE